MFCIWERSLEVEEGEREKRGIKRIKMFMYQFFIMNVIILSTNSVCEYNHYIPQTLI